MSCTKSFSVILLGDGTEVSRRSGSVPIIRSLSLPSTLSVNLAEGQTVLPAIAVTGGQAPSFDITGGADQALFTIDSVTGIPTKTVAPDDADVGDQYVFIVTVSDPIVSSVAQTVTVTVQAVAEEILGSMAFQDAGSDSYSIAGAVAFIATLTDSDAAVNSVVEGAATDAYTGLTVATNMTNATFSIIAQEEAGAFKINPNTGAVDVDDGTRLVYA